MTSQLFDRKRTWFEVHFTSPYDGRASSREFSTIGDAIFRAWEVLPLLDDRYGDHLVIHEYEQDVHQAGSTSWPILTVTETKDGTGNVLLAEWKKANA